MKTRLIAVMMIALFGFSSVLVKADGFRRDQNWEGTVKIIKGVLVDIDGDHSWDYLTFSVVGLGRLDVKSVELADLNQDFITEASLYQIGGRPGRIDYVVDLKNKVSGDFLTKIHISKRGHGSSSPATLDGMRVISGIEPGDPEETIIVIKWP